MFMFSCSTKGIVIRNAKCFNGLLCSKFKGNATFYDYVGLGTCGEINNNEQLPWSMFDPSPNGNPNMNPNCNGTINILFNLIANPDEGRVAVSYTLT
ncbi:hypothetical protein Glove_609g33 [Diversispora epigaea]|uniref:Uncharacterized protein n=1 Tax=Diversispora epigaea TaxID=1348612 RepID=A0A397G6P2_9GLOM|nr:hypothetical protein Glove_609g33 [Diversispora epigaea]